jgi:lipoprotein-anchoring transpeptidase ErfK/SrfK
MSFSRRSFLKMSSAALGAVAAATSHNTTWAAGPAPKVLAPPAPLGRVANWGVEVFLEPTRRSEMLRTAPRDDVINLYGQVQGEAVFSHNRIWFKTDGGYCHSSYVQPVTSTAQMPKPELAAKWFWGEVAVPFSDVFWQPTEKSKRMTRVYFASVFRVIAAVQDKAQQWWYRLQEGIAYGPGPYIRAEHIRRITPEELAPISPKVTHKRIEVDLKNQMMTAFEGQTAVHSSRIASGKGQFFTPKGTHSVIFKQPTARMLGGVDADAYDFPGVPFPTFFTLRGAAFHGAYWHNDFGVKRSHGCLNVPPQTAMWIWRWTTPIAQYAADQTFAIAGQSTQVIVF